MFELYLGLPIPTHSPSTSPFLLVKAPTMSSGSVDTMPLTLICPIMVMLSSYCSTFQLGCAPSTVKQMSSGVSSSLLPRALMVVKYFPIGLPCLTVNVTPLAVFDLILTSVSLTLLPNSVPIHPRIFASSTSLLREGFWCNASHIDRFRSSAILPK